MNHDEGDALRLLDRLLDDATPRRPLPSDTHNPALRATVRHLRALHDIAPPEGAHERVWQRTTTTAAATGAIDWQTTAEDSPIRNIVPIAHARTLKRRSSNRWHPYAELAAVAAILTVLLGGYAVGYRVLPVLTGSRSQTTPARPAASGSAPIDNPELRWQFQTGGPIRSQPVIANGVAYFGSGDSHLYAVDAATGVERWRFVLNAGGSSPAVVDGVLYTGSEGIFYALDAATGKERWHFQDSTLGLGHASPAVMDGTIYVAGAVIDGEHPGGGTLISLDMANGKERWRFPTVALPFGPTVADGVVYFVSDDSVHAVDAATGTERWRVETGVVLGSATAIGGTVYVSGLWDPIVIALDAATGQDRWRVNTHDANGGGLDVAEGVVYVTGENRLRGSIETDADVAALDAATGRVLWRTFLGTGMTGSVAAPTVADGDVYLVASGTLIVLDAATGNEAWRFPIGNNAAASPPPDAGVGPAMFGEWFIPPAVADGIVYVAAGDGTLYAIGGSAG